MVLDMSRHYSRAVLLRCEEIVHTVRLSINRETDLDARADDPPEATVRGHHQRIGTRIGL